MSKHVEPSRRQWVMLKDLTHMFINFGCDITVKRDVIDRRFIGSDEKVMSWALHVLVESGFIREVIPDYVYIKTNKGE